MSLIEKGLAAYKYKNKRSEEDFLEDLARLKYIKRLINRKLDGGVINDRLLLNHIIIWFNVFETHEGLAILIDAMCDDQAIELLLCFTDFIGITTTMAPDIQRTYKVAV